MPELFFLLEKSQSDLSAEEVWQSYQLGQTRINAGNYYYRNSTSLNNNFLFALGTTGNINTTTGNPSSWGTGY